MAQRVISGQKTVTTAGIAVVLGGTDTINNAVLIKADPSNTGKVFVGNNGSNTVTSGTGFILSAGEMFAYYDVGSLSKIYVNADTNNQKVCWTVLGV